MPTVFGTNSQTFNANGTFTVPAGITSIVVECWGGGGSGGRAVGIVGGTKKAAGGGGGGGAYARSTLTVTPGSTHTVNVAAAQTTSGTDGNSSWFGSSSTVLAVGGKGGGNQTEQSGADTLGLAGLGGDYVFCIGNVAYSGGDGSGYDPGKAPCLYAGWSGAGGGGAGNTQDGNDAPCPATTAPPGLGGSAYGGDGASGVSTGNVGNSGNLRGGGGSGGHTRDITIGQRQGGAGAAGTVIVWWTPSTPPSPTQTVCTACSPIVVGCYFYIGNPETPAPDGYYSSGSACYTVTDGTGYVSAVSPYVTISWDVRESGSGAVQLVIKDVDNLQLVNEESSSSGPLSGSVTIPQSKTPYSVTVTLLAGTEVAKYRICNTTLSTEITYNDNVTTSDTYIVSPTPLSSAVFATYGSITPLACPVP